MISMNAKTGVISTFAGTGAAGFSGDGGPATRAQLRQPHSIAVDRRGILLICDIGNHRIRQVDLSSGIIESYGRDAGEGGGNGASHSVTIAGTLVG
jgi:hypothetical protein